MASLATLESPAVCCWRVDVDGEAEDVPSSPRSDTSAFFWLSTDFEEAVDMASLRSRVEVMCVVKEEDQVARWRSFGREFIRDAVAQAGGFGKS